MLKKFSRMSDYAHELYGIVKNLKLIGGAALGVSYFIEPVRNFYAELVNLLPGVNLSPNDLVFFLATSIPASILIASTIARYTTDKDFPGIKEEFLQK